MPDKGLSLQDQFLNNIRRTKSPTTVFLMKGVKLQGIITWFDPFSLLLRRDGNSLLVYKHAISTVMPAIAPSDLALPEGGNGKRPPLQDLFLQAAAREREAMTIFLVNGVMLQGAVAGHDQFSLLLERGGQVQLVYKHAISTLQPGHPLDLSEPAGDGD
ncbi:MAG: RNA chaperone Hfq [Sphingomonas sp.]|uniref:RNA chaperone Hfq n=1 Tax=Sphingomonas sp. TaxID=28214 RepID=UPI0017905BB4|nr:RNA chaperone Hfq [Sphingomonas sp.]MBA3667055.1 RNA chaperone Hfq [Sphingomonas sp.]